MDQTVARLIARVLAGRPWDVDSVAARLTTALGSAGHRSKWPRRLVEHLLLARPECRQLPSESGLVQILQTDPVVERLTSRPRRSLSRWARQFDQSALPRPWMSPAAAARDWDVPPICTAGQLCDFLQVPLNRLLWLADRRLTEYRQRKEKLRNYRYFRLSKRTGGSRLIEAPKSELKRIQRRISDRILRSVPVHPNAHGYAEGRSCVTAARVHTQQPVVMRIDLKDFFPSITARRVAGLFRTAGYPNSVVSLLTGLCTNRTWCGAVEPDIDPCDCLFVSHLPQGSAASPFLANACAWSLDRRLTGLAEKFRAHYTRYADDLHFSGDREFDVRLSRFRICALAIIANEGFGIRTRKTQIMRRDAQQRVTGIVVNQRTNVNRQAFDRLKAILTNCLRYGLDSQNRNQHAHFSDCLRGQIGWVQAVNPKRGQRLLELWKQMMAAERSRNQTSTVFRSPHQ